MVRRCFLKEDDEEDFKSMEKDSESFINQWFFVVRGWKPRDDAGARFIWCKMYGIFIHA